MHTTPFLSIFDCAPLSSAHKLPAARMSLTSGPNARTRVMHEATAHFKAAFPNVSTHGLVAGISPGRVNLIGDHVDYVDGFVLPIVTFLSTRRIQAIPLYTVVLGKPAPSGHKFTRIYSTHYDEFVDLEAGKEVPQWASYIFGIFTLHTPEVPLDVVVHTTIPIGAGLSSSAAVELASFYLFDQFKAAKASLPKKQIALLCQKAEHEFAGMPCGIMDQFVCALAEAGYAVKIDCSLGAHSWREVTPQRLEAIAVDLSEEERDCAHHVLGETKRTVEAAQALSTQDPASFGRLMQESHASLRDLYRVSCSEIDAIVDMAMRTNGVYGARMTGGGFGGCVVALVKNEAFEEVKRAILALDPERIRFFAAEAVGGAESQTDP